MKILILLLLSCASINAYDKLEPVDYVEPQKYMGKWFEIARFDQVFQRNCTAVTAEYSLKDNGEIKVINSCRKYSPNGKLKRAKARAWIVNEGSNSKLKVQFFLKFIKLALFSGDYWIIELDEQNYSYAVVGDPSRKYLWFLYRESKMPEELFERLKTRVAKKGFDTSKLLKTVH